MRLRNLAVATFVFLLFADSGYGQSRSLRIVVLDPSGARITSAHIKVEAKRSAPRLAEADEAGEALFFNLPTGKARVTAVATGFTRQVLYVQVDDEENVRQIHMRIQPVRDQVEVRPEKREEDTSSPSAGFSTVLTQEQIENLSDDPDEMKTQLQNIAGPGAVILVDGFSANRLPAKSQIASIRIRLSSYSAEDHDYGFATIDIRTKAGVGGWHGTAGLGYSGDELNARNYFAPAREPEQSRRINIDVSGPLWRDHTSVSLWFSRSFAYDTTTTVGITPSGRFTDLVRMPHDYDRFGARLLHKLNKGHRELVELDQWTQSGGRIGQFDLPERFAKSRRNARDLKFADYGVLSPRSLNDIRFRATWNSWSSVASSDAPAVIVNGAFSSGGANARSDRSTVVIEFTDDFRISAAGHGFSAGFQVATERNRQHNLDNANGTFVFTSLAAYIAGSPTLYSRLNNDQAISNDQYRFAGYVQDEFRPKQNLSLSLGARWEAQTRAQSSPNVAPRLGFAWSPFRSAKTTVRGGFGTFYQWIPPAVYAQTLLFDGLSHNTTIILNPGYPNPFQGGTPVSIPSTVYLYNSALPLPYLLRSSFSVQQQIRAFKLTTDLRWQRGFRLPWLNNLNQPFSSGVRPNPAEGNVFQVQQGASSLLKEWVTSLNGNSRRYTWSVIYTLANQTNQVDGPWQPPSDSRNLRADQGPAGNDVRHRLNGYATCRFAKGIRLSLLPSFNSAEPYNITTGFDNNGDTLFNDRPLGVSRNSGRGGPTLKLDGRLSWTFSFGPETNEDKSYEFRVGPNSPGGGIEIEIPRRRYQLQTSVQASNAFNTVNFVSYVGTSTSPTFGQPTAAMPARRLEVGVRFLF